jgi:hypothetical protein
MPRLKRRSTLTRHLAVALLLLDSAGSPLAMAQPVQVEDVAGSVRSVAVVGTEFRVTLADGRVLAQEDLVGMVLAVSDDVAVRIDSVERDPGDPEGEIVLYGLSRLDPATGEARNLCRPDPDGRRLGFPLAGVWTADGRHVRSDTRFSLTCTSGTEGKCVRFGYRPWRTRPDGISLWDLHQACTRLLRADYCGDGQPHTRDGTRIALYDRLGIQPDGPTPGMSFEAAWGPDGAVCVRRVRWPDLLSLDTLAATCPRLTPDRLGPTCGEAADALLFNRAFASD